MRGVFGSFPSEGKKRNGGDKIDKISLLRKRQE
jgi:hypothetical protein